MTIHPLRGVSSLLRRVLTREVPAVYFSDGDLFIIGHHAIPKKPTNIGAQTIQVRVPRWKRTKR